MDAILRQRRTTNRLDLTREEAKRLLISIDYDLARQQESDLRFHFFQLQGREDEFHQDTIILRTIKHQLETMKWED